MGIESEEQKALDRHLRDLRCDYPYTKDELLLLLETKDTLIEELRDRVRDLLYISRSNSPF